MCHTWTSGATLGRHSLEVAAGLPQIPLELFPRFSPGGLRVFKPSFFRAKYVKRVMELK